MSETKDGRRWVSNEGGIFHLRVSSDYDLEVLTGEGWKHWDETIEPDAPSDDRDGLIVALTEWIAEQLAGAGAAVEER